MAVLEYGQVHDRDAHSLGQLGQRQPVPQQQLVEVDPDGIGIRRRVSDPGGPSPRGPRPGGPGGPGPGPCTGPCPGPRAAGGDYDLVVEAAGTTDAVLSGLGAARRGGTVVLLGLPPHGATAAVPVDDVVNNDLVIRGSFGYTSSAWRDVVTLLNAGRLDLGFLVTHQFPLAEWEAALDTLRGSASPRGKVMLTVTG